MLLNIYTALVRPLLEFCIKVLKKLGLTKLVERRKRGDIIETYKINTGKEKMDPNYFFKLAAFRGRGHSKK